MTQPAVSEKNRKRYALFLTLFTGIIGAVCLIFTFFYYPVLWTPLVTYNRFLLMIQIPQMLLASLFILLLSGACAMKYRWPMDPGSHDAIKQGIITGVVMGIVVALFIANTGVLYGNPPWPIIVRWFALMVAICISGTVVGAYLFFRSQMIANETASENPGKKQVPFTVTLLVIGIVLTLVLPPAFAFVGTRSGFIANDCSECRIHQNVMAERLSNQSIQITYTSKVPSVPWVGPYEPPVITLNGNDVSSQSVILRQGIPCSIEPAEGLSYDTESIVVLNGRAVSSDENGLTHVVVVSRNGSPAGVTLYDNSL